MTTNSSEVFMYVYPDLYDHQLFTDFFSRPCEFSYIVTSWKQETMMCQKNKAVLNKCSRTITQLPSAGAAQAQCK
jgi:hypothetical protein